jgi:hypothetical protein
MGWFVGQWQYTLPAEFGGGEGTITAVVMRVERDRWLYIDGDSEVVWSDPEGDHGLFFRDLYRGEVNPMDLYKLTSLEPIASSG